MPEDERPPAASDLSRDDRLELLRKGRLEIEGRMPWSSNATFLVNVQAGGRSLRAIYKPGAGERPLRDFPGGLYRREVAAYELSVCTGLEVVPETVLRESAPLGEGSVQAFVDADFSEHYFSLVEVAEHGPALRQMAGFDLLANNADRKGGHLLLDASGAIWGIDHGLCFHEAPKLRTVMWDFAGEPLPEAVIEAASRVAPRLAPDLAGLLGEGERRALRRRAARLLERPVFPCPDRQERSYPWPLV